MVYCGKPSKACQHCRKRKLRCDLRKEGCSQCSRANLICQGYRDPDQLRIRDQTHSVSQKILNKKNVANPTAVISILLKDQARAAFFSNYVFYGSKSYDFLEPFYSSANVGEPLSASLDAVSLAFFAHQENAALAGRESRKRYTSALSQVQWAITSAEVARTDSTLLATMLLDLYEKITNLNPESDKLWRSHVHGSLALAELRGPRLFRDRNGFRMVLRLNTNLLINCVATDTPPPAGLVALRNHASKYLDSKDPKWLLTDLMLKYVGMREIIRKGQLTDCETIASLLELDAEYANLAATSPVAWQGRRIWLCSPTGCTLDGYMDIYLSYHFTQTWNVARLIRILLNESLREYSTTPSGVGWAYDEGTSLRTRAEEVTRDLVVEICASAPQYTSPEFAKAQSVSPFSHEDFTTPENGNLNAVKNIRVYSPAEKVRAYSVIFPLFVAGQSIATTERQKLFIVNQLHFMANTMGIKNAEVVAKILEAGVKTNPWKVYALLGSYAFAA